MTTKQNAPGAEPRGVQRSARATAETTIVARHPVAYAETCAPAGRRTLPAISYACPYCRGTHFGRARDDQAVTGVRRSGCGRLVWLVAARTYPGVAE